MRLWIFLSVLMTAQIVNAQVTVPYRTITGKDALIKVYEKPPYAFAIEEGREMRYHGMTDQAVDLVQSSYEYVDDVFDRKINDTVFLHEASFGVVLLSIGKMSSAGGLYFLSRLGLDMSIPSDHRFIAKLQNEPTAPGILDYLLTEQRSNRRALLLDSINVFREAYLHWLAHTMILELGFEVIPYYFPSETWSSFKMKMAQSLSEYEADDNRDVYTDIKDHHNSILDTIKYGKNVQLMFNKFIYLYDQYGGRDFIRKFNNYVNRDDSWYASRRDIQDEIILASSFAAGENLIPLFVDRWKWEISDSARVLIPKVLSTHSSIAQDEWQLSPNPASTHLDIRMETEGHERWTIAIFDLLGRPVLKTQQEGSFSKRIDITNLKAGTYFVSLSSDRRKGGKLLIIE